MTAGVDSQSSPPDRRVFAPPSCSNPNVPPKVARSEHEASSHRAMLTGHIFVQRRAGQGSIVSARIPASCNPFDPRSQAPELTCRVHCCRSSRVWALPRGPTPWAQCKVGPILRLVCRPVLGSPGRGPESAARKSAPGCADAEGPEPIRRTGSGVPTSPPPPPLANIGADRTVRRAPGALLTGAGVRTRRFPTSGRSRGPPPPIDPHSTSPGARGSMRSFP